MACPNLGRAVRGAGQDILKGSETASGPQDDKREPGLLEDVTNDKRTPQCLK